MTTSSLAGRKERQELSSSRDWTPGLRSHLARLASFALAVRRAFLRERPDCVAVELPETLTEPINRAVRRLPLLSVLRYEMPDGPAFLLVEPCDGIFEALRLAREHQVPWHLVDRDSDRYDAPRDALPDPHAIDRIGYEAYVEKVAPVFLEEAISSEDELREATMAFHLSRLLEEHEKVLFVCGLGHALATNTRRPAYLPSGTTSPRSTATWLCGIEDADVGRDLGRGLGGVVLGVEEALVGQQQHRRLALALDPGEAEIELSVAQELGQRLGQFLARQQHGVAEVQAALGIGQELVAQDALVDLAAILVGLPQLGFGVDLGAGRHEAGHQLGGVVDQPLDAHELAGRRSAGRRACGHGGAGR